MCVSSLSISLGGGRCDDDGDDDDDDSLFCIGHLRAPRSALLLHLRFLGLPPLWSLYHTFFDFVSGAFFFFNSLLKFSLALSLAFLMISHYPVDIFHLSLALSLGGSHVCIGITIYGGRTTMYWYGPNGIDHTGVRPVLRSSNWVSCVLGPRGVIIHITFSSSWKVSKSLVSCPSPSPSPSPSGAVGELNGDGHSAYGLVTFRVVLWGWNHYHHHVGRSFGPVISTTTRQRFSGLEALTRCDAMRWVSRRDTMLLAALRLLGVSGRPTSARGDG